MKKTLFLISCTLLCGFNFFPGKNLSPTNATSTRSVDLIRFDLNSSLLNASTPSSTPTPEMTPVPPEPEERTYKEIVQQSVTSPDGKLAANLYEIMWHSLFVQTIEILDMEGEVVATISYQEQMPAGAPQKSMRIIGWSPDSSTVFFFYPWGYDGGGVYIFNGARLQALKVKDHIFEEIAPGNRISFSISPDGTKIAYTSDDRVGIYDIASAVNKSVQIKIDRISHAGNIFWSPENTGFVYTVMKDDYAENTRELYLDEKTMEQVVLMDDVFIEGYRFVDWDKVGNPRYRVYNPDMDSGEIVAIDKRSAKSQVIGTPTPTPLP